MKPTYKELLERVKSRQTPSFSPEQLGFTTAALRSISNVPLDTFSAGVVSTLVDAYAKNPDFKTMLDSDIKKGTDVTLRKVQQLLQSVSQKLRNVETKNVLQNNSSEVAKKIVKNLEKALKQGNAVPTTPNL